MVFVAIYLAPGVPQSILVAVLNAGLAVWMYFEQMVLPNARLQDKHLALLAEIGFNERDAGKALKADLKKKGYLTYLELRIAQKQYDKDNAREYSLRENGAKTFLADN